MVLERWGGGVGQSKVIRGMLGGSWVLCVSFVGGRGAPYLEHRRFLARYGCRNSHVLRHHKTDFLKKDRSQTRAREGEGQLFCRPSMLLHPFSLLCFPFALLLLPTSHAATVAWLNSSFTFTSNGAGTGFGFDIHMDCPGDKWCGMVVAGSTGMKSEDIFDDGDTYILARHALCGWACCRALAGNPAPDYSCPHPKCCKPGNDSVVGLRSFPSVMGTGWSGGTGVTDGLRGPTCARSALGDSDFRPTRVVGGRLRMYDTEARDERDERDERGKRRYSCVAKCGVWCAYRDVLGRQH